MVVLTRRELLLSAERLCNDFSSKKDIDILMSHFSSIHQVTAIEHGEPSLAPFLGRLFVGHAEIRKYFETIGSFLSYENMRFSDFVVDTEARKVATKASARFTWLHTGESWDEVFAYLLGFDEENKVTAYEVWADSGAAFLASRGRLDETRKEINKVNERVYANINSTPVSVSPHSKRVEQRHIDGVYRAEVGTSPPAYETAVAEGFEALDEAEKLFEGKGYVLTRADIRLSVTTVYHRPFSNLLHNQLKHAPADPLQRRLLRQLQVQLRIVRYGYPAIHSPETHWLRWLNLHRIVPAGPDSHLTMESLHLSISTQSQAADQGHLTEDLWFLKKLRFSERLGFYPSGRNLLSVLDAVALFLTTGDPDATIATFYTPTKQTLILAKAGPVGSRDVMAVRSFICELEEAKDWKDLLPFLAKRSGPYVNKRIEKICELFGHHYDLLYDRATQLKDSRSADALKNCRHLLACKVPFGDSLEACKNFYDLVLAAHTVITSPALFVFPRPDAVLDTLKHRLEKLSQYAGARRLLSFWKQHKSVHIVWVPDAQEQPLTYVLSTDQIVSKHTDEILAYEPDHIERLEVTKILRSQWDWTSCPGWRGEEGPTSITVTLCVHAEIRLILHLSGTAATATHNFPSELIVGCSQRTCLCCTLWIDAFNAATDMNWMTRSGNSHPRYDWVFPSSPVAVDTADVLRLDVISGEVKGRLRAVLLEELDEAEESRYEDVMMDNRLEALEALYSSGTSEPR
ncbi:hypothetical protein DXG01_007418 [Tephrocybe rancida]|nr:hypothetical protein DXG01_007418 [Tephrocybe rancida]